MKANIEKEINALINNMTAHLSEDYTVVKERPTKWSTCRKMVAVYRNADLRRQRAEAGSSRREACDQSRYKATPVLRYTFYSSNYDADRLGSVAIYGANAAAEYMDISKAGHFFGAPVRSIDFEIGRRPFVNVVLRP